MSPQVPELRTCSYCRGSGERGGLACLACRGAGMVWVPVPDAGCPAADWLPEPRRTPES